MYNYTYIRATKSRNNVYKYGIIIRNNNCYLQLDSFEALFFSRSAAGTTRIAGNPRLRAVANVIWKVFSLNSAKMRAETSLNMDREGGWQRSRGARRERGMNVRMVRTMTSARAREYRLILIMESGAGETLNFPAGVCLSLSFFFHAPSPSL